MSQITASSLQRVAACPASAVLPQIGSERGESASRGTYIHAFLDACSKTSREQALEECSERWPDMAPVFNLIDLQRLPAGAGEWLTEIAMAVNYNTGVAREIKEFDERHQYAIGPHEVAGTADVLGLTEDAVVVYDYKTGFGDVPSPKNNWQLKFLAYAGSRLFGKNKAIAGIIWVREDGNHIYQQVTFDEFDLASIGADLQFVMEQVEKISPENPGELYVGSHCRYCPAYRVCPAQGKMLNEVLEADYEGAISGALSHAEMGEAAFKIKRAQERLEALWEVVKTFALNGPLPLPDGRELAPVLVATEKIEAFVATGALKELYGDDLAEACVERVAKISKESIKDALRKAKGSKGIGKELDKALTAIRAAGGVQTSSYTKYVERERREDGV